jgi:single-strand DNA-binding protein
MLNAVIAGNIGKDAETRSAGQTTVTGFNVAVEQRGKDGKKTQWVGCSMWGKRGETLAQYLTKGSKVCVSGELTTREHDGKTYLDLNVSDVTLMGGKPDGNGDRDSGQRDTGGYGNSGGGSGYGAGNGGQGGDNRDLGDEIPF